jgi:hypothetical protein
MLGIRSFKVSPEFDSLPPIFDFPDQTQGLCGANSKLIDNSRIDSIGINIIKKVVVVI